MPDLSNLNLELFRHGIQKSISYIMNWPSHHLKRKITGKGSSNSFSKADGNYCQ